MDDIVRMAMGGFICEEEFERRFPEFPKDKLEWEEGFMAAWVHFCNGLFGILDGRKLTEIEAGVLAIIYGEDYQSIVAEILEKEEKAMSKWVAGLNLP